VLGRALRDFTSREQVVVATKAFFPMSDDPNDRGLSRKHLMSAPGGAVRAAPRADVKR
jgi:aryl-alcohol dehydrogenase (NADP+)